MFSRLIRLWDNYTLKDYSATKDMLRVFFSCQHDDFGNTLDEIMTRYVDYDIASSQVKKETEKLLQINDDEKLNIIMGKLSGGEFRPESWGLTWRSFLLKVQSYL